MHGAAFFCCGAGRSGAEEKNFGAGQGENARGGAGEQVNPGAFSGRGILENFRGRGAPGQPFPPGSGRGGVRHASLVKTTSPLKI